MTFIPNNYFKIVTTDLFLSVRSFQDLYGSSKKAASNEFISAVYGKMSLLGYSGKSDWNILINFKLKFLIIVIEEVLSEVFLKNLIKICYKDMSGRWSLVAQSFFKSIGYKYLESCLINLIKTASW